MKLTAEEIAWVAKATAPVPGRDGHGEDTSYHLHRLSFQKGVVGGQNVLMATDKYRMHLAIGAYRKNEGLHTRSGRFTKEKGRYPDAGSIGDLRRVVQGVAGRIEDYPTEIYRNVHVYVIKDKKGTVRVRCEHMEDAVSLEGEYRLMIDAENPAVHAVQVAYFQKEFLALVMPERS